MPDKWPLANGNWSNAANWNDGTKPVAGDDVFADGKTLNVDESFDVATLRTTQRSGGTLGGTFNFNTAGVTGTVTSSTPLAGGSIIQVTAPSGLVTLNMNNASGTITGAIVSHTGNCNFNLNATPTYTFTVSGTQNGISKSSTGTITIVANLIGGAVINISGQNAFSSTAGNTIITGNVTGGSPSGIGAASNGVLQTAGNLTINGNIRGGTGSASTNYGVNFSGAILTINGDIQTLNSTSIPVLTSAPIFNLTGNVTGGTSVQGISTSGTTNTITGNVTAGTVSAITSTSANIINVTGTVTASATSQAISMTNANGQVYLNGNMVNNNGKMAIYAPIVWLDANNTTSAAFFTSGGVARTLYSEDTFPNMPAEANTRNNIVYGPGSGLRGTLKMPAAADTRNGVVYDNGTTGTALFTTATLLSEINSSSDAVAVRMRNCATPQILGEILEAFKK